MSRLPQITVLQSDYKESKKKGHTFEVIAAKNFTEVSINDVLSKDVVDELINRDIEVLIKKRK